MTRVPSTPSPERIEQQRARLKVLQRENPPLDCPECDGELILRYSYRYDRFFYGCTNWKWTNCPATHSAHQETGRPMGTPADRETKRWRQEAHRVFDQLWKGPGPTMSRSSAYTYAANLMGLSSDDMHIARFDVEQCRRLIRVITGTEPPDLPAEEGSASVQVTPFSETSTQSPVRLFNRRRGPVSRPTERPSSSDDDDENPYGRKLDI